MKSFGLKLAKFNNVKIWGAAILAGVMTVVGCGGGGGHGSAPSVIYYPFKTVYGDVCNGQKEPSPGCTFNRNDGSRVKVSQDPHYNYYGNGSNDMYYVIFDYSGNATVYDRNHNIVEYKRVSDFSGWVGGDQIGVGTSGLYWEDVAGGTYWYGKNGVLYNANSGESNYGNAINSEDSDAAADSNFVALNSEANLQLVEKAADKLVKDYEFSKDKAVAVASALNSWAITASERGFVTEKDMDKTFTTVFGSNFSSALTAVKALQKGDASKMQAFTAQSASSLGLKPHQAKKFIKGMYKDALTSFGYDANQINW